MNFVYYTDKTVSQCMIALNERLQTKSAKLEGWVEKSGRFSLGVTTTVMRRFPRTTRLEARVERENGITVIKGFVSDGVEPRQRAIIYGALVLAGVLIILSGSLLPGLLALVAPLPLNIPLEGDCNNSQILLGELQRTLRAKSTPPAPTKKAPTVRKPPTAMKPATPKKPTTSRTTTAKKTAAVGTRK